MLTPSSGDGHKPVRLKPLLAFAAGHATVDVYGSFLPPLLPIFAERMGLSLVLVGTLASIMSISDGITQPLFGLWGDRMRKPWIAVVTPLITALATGFLGLAPSYAVLAMLLAISGTARSAYHPQAAAGMAEHSGPRRGFFMSIFTALGNVGYASGPILATSLVALGGLSATLYAMPIGIVAAAALYAAIIRGAPERPATWKPPAVRDVLQEILGMGKGFSLLLSVVMLRSLTVFTLAAFLPIVLTRWGYSSMATGVTVSAFLYGGTAGGLIGGWFSDRFGEKAVISVSHIIALPFILLALWAPGGVTLPFLLLGGFSLLASSPSTITLAQRYAPGSIATATSLMLGLGWSLGGAMVTAVGYLADHIGPVSAIRAESFLLIVATVLALFLPPAPPVRER